MQFLNCKSGDVLSKAMIGSLLCIDPMRVAISALSSRLGSPCSRSPWFASGSRSLCYPKSLGIRPARNAAPNTRKRSLAETQRQRFRHALGLQSRRPA